MSYNPLPPTGQATSIGSLPVVLASDQSPISVALPTGQATSANQLVANTSLASIDTKLSLASSPFVSHNGPQFFQKGKPFKYTGFNYYPLIIGSDYKRVFDDLKAIGATVLRTWCFDGPIGFRSLAYPVGSNLITAGDNGTFEANTTGITLGTDFTWSTDTAEDGTHSIKQVSSGGYSSMAIPCTVVANTSYIFTYWHKTTNVAGPFPDIQFIGTAQGDNSILDGGFITDTAGAWQQHQLLFNSGAHTSIVITLGNFSGTVNAYFDKVNVSVNTGALPTLAYNEGTLVGLDTILDEGRKRGIKLMLSLADGNYFNYNTKGMYVGWANSVNGTSLDGSQHGTDFYSSPLVKNLYKDFIKTLTQRINTVNNIQYKDDPTIFSWELGNELRVEAFEDGRVNSLASPNLALLSLPGGWADEMSTYIKSYDPNHMVGFGDMGHTWQYSQDNNGIGDAVSNGTYYGVDYNYLSALPNIDYLDFHIYPEENDGIHLAANSGKYWGQRFGYINGSSGDGFRAQLNDYVKVAHANNKPAICGETGEDVGNVGDNSLYPLYNRYTYFKNFFKDFMDISGGDGINIWHAVPAATTGGSFDVALEAVTGAGVTDNSSDLDIINLIKTYNTGFLNDITPAGNVTSLIKTSGNIVSKNLNPNDATVSVQLSDTWTGTVQFESSLDGITWYSQSMKDNTGTAVTSATVVGLFTGVISGLNKFRVRASAAITGALTVNIQSSIARS